MRGTASGRPDFLDQDIREAKMTIAKWKAVLVLLEEDLFAAHITICEFDMGVCDTKDLIPVVRQNIAEIQKFLDGKPNKWE